MGWREIQIKERRKFVPFRHQGDGGQAKRAAGEPDKQILILTESLRRDMGERGLFDN